MIERKVFVPWQQLKIRLLIISPLTPFLDANKGVDKQSLANQN